MLAIPMGFADWLALSYSGFASVKLVLIALGMLLLVISVMTSIAGRLIKKPSKGYGPRAIRQSTSQRRMIYQKGE
ncbi:hypothetical protein [Sulfitobacter sp.]|uniref:hypothetical protein n=1 Tax=Sulfitobacter sp. TaxID=1903071 RepID=UPI003001DE15